MRVATSCGNPSRPYDIQRLGLPNIRVPVPIAGPAFPQAEPNFGQPRKNSHRRGRFFNAKLNRAKQQTTQMAKTQTSMRWITAVGRFPGTKPVSNALTKSIHAPTPTPKKLASERDCASSSVCAIIN